MKKNRPAAPSTALVRIPRGAGAELGPVRPPGDLSQNPAAVYLARLAPDSRPAQKNALHTISRLVSPDADAFRLPWQNLRFSHTGVIRAKLVEHYAPRTVNRMLSAMRSVLKTAWQLELMTTDDYMRAIQVKQQSTRGLPPAGRYVEEKEIAEVLRAAARQKAPLAHRDQAIVIMMYAGGLRRQEASALDLADYDPKNGAFAVRRGKRGKYRDLAIVSGYRGWLEPWVTFQRERKCEPMFVRWNRVGPTMNRLGRVGIDHVLERLRKTAGVDDFDPHDLRRSFATLLLDKGVDVMVVQDLLGHEDLATTKIYDRRGEKTRRAAVERLPVALTYDEFLKST